MERLTTRHSGVAVIKDTSKHKEAMEKLARYEELEEQGLLLKLPCKVGDKAYHIIKDNIAIPPIYISEHEITDVSAKAVRFADDWWTFEEMYENNAFLNKAEAEKALAEMTEGKI